MQRAVLFLILAGVATGRALVASPTAACTAYQDARERAEGPFDSVVVGRIVHANTIGSSRENNQAWTATAIVEGRIADRIFQIHSNLTDCGEKLNMPRVGEAWVLYIKRDHGRSMLFHAMALTRARKEDPRFGGPPYPTPAQKRRRAEEIRRIDGALDDRARSSGGVPHP